MSCRDIQETLSALMDHEATASERAAIDAHMPNCASCRAAQSTLATLRAATRRLPHETAPMELRSRIQQLSRADSGGTTVGHRVAALFRAPFARPIAAGALAAMVLVLGTANIVRTKVVQPRVRLARQLVVDCQSHTGAAFDVVSSDPATVSAYFNDREPVKALVDAVPATNVHGTLIGGSVCDVCDQRAAHLTLRDAHDNKVAVYVLRAADQPTGWGKRTVFDGGAYQVANVQGDAVVTWVGGRARYAVVTTATSDEALRLASTLRGAFED